MNSTTVKHSNRTDADLATFFLSNSTSNESFQKLDEVFLNHMTSAILDQQQAIGPPPGFENIRLNSSDSHLPPHSSSDTINFSQLLPSTTVEQQAMVETILSSSHSSFPSDEQSIFYPSYATSQIYSTNTPSSSMTTTTRNSTAKPNGLSLMNNRFLSSSSLLANSTHDSPTENEKNGGISSDSFFPNGHTDLKFPTNKISSTTIRTSSSTSSSSSIDEALTQLSQQHYTGNGKKLFNTDPTSIFHFPSLPAKINLEKEQEQAVHDNINFLASMSMASPPVPPMDLSRQTSVSSAKQSLNIQELINNVNEICYKGFDELNALIQEQRWVQSYVSINASSPHFPSHGSNCCSSRILIVVEYFIYKCKKVEQTASHVFELLANTKVELRLQDLMFVFQSWKETISTAETIHRDEENKLRLNSEHPQSYYMTENVRQSAFDRVSRSMRQLCHITQQVRAAFQYATVNVFQLSSRQQIQSQSSIHSISLAQNQAMQQPKSSSMSRSNGTIH